MANKGIVYVMEACNTEGLVKIGKCALDQFENRMYIEERNGYCNVPVKRRFAMVVDEYSRKEDLLHEAFGFCQLGKTELFAADINRVIKLMSALDGKKIYPEDETKEEIFEDAADATETTLLPEGTYTYVMKSQKDKKNYSGTLIHKDGKLTLLKGSHLAPLTECGSKSWIQVRQNLKLVDGATVEDVPCSSVSEAANFVCGHRKNGWRAWKNSEGNFIDIYRKK